MNYLQILSFYLWVYMLQPILSPCLNSMIYKLSVNWLDSFHCISLNLLRQVDKEK